MTHPGYCFPSLDECCGECHRCAPFVVDPCDYCAHDNTEHAEDGCRNCGCAVPQ